MLQYLLYRSVIAGVGSTVHDIMLYFVPCINLCFFQIFTKMGGELVSLKATLTF